MTRLCNRELLRRGRFKALRTRGALGLPELRSALRDSDRRVRRNALRVLDHIPNAGCTREIVDLLHDEHEEVRKWAAHALGCDRCKPGDLPDLDPVPALIRVATTDSSRDVRRAAVVCLAWNRPADRRITSFLDMLERSTSDRKIRLHAEQGRARHVALAQGVRTTPRATNRVARPASSRDKGGRG